MNNPSTITTRPLVESNIPLSAIPVTFNKNGTDYKCISSNLKTDHCGLLNTDDNSDCIAYCPDLPSLTIPKNRLIKFIPNSLNPSSALPINLSSIAVNNPLSNSSSVLRTPSNSPSVLLTPSNTASNISGNSNNILTNTSYLANPTNTTQNIPSKSTFGSWTNNTLSSYPSTNPIRTLASTPITFTDTDNTNLSCYYINIGSNNCPTNNTFGCKAYCIKPNGNNFIIKQQCKLNPTSCNRSDLTWVKQ